MGSKQLVDDSDLLDIVDPHKNDGDVAGNAVSPEHRGPAAPGADSLGRWT
jgi:hypothetical protein